MSRCFAARLSRRAALVLAGATTAGLARPVAAQGRFPEHPIRMLLPFTPGGPTDVQMRTLCDLAAKRLSRAVVIEQRIKRLVNVRSTGPRPESTVKSDE